MIRICTKEDKGKLIALAHLNKVFDHEYYFDHEFAYDTVYGYFDGDELLGYVCAQNLDLRLGKHSLYSSYIKDIVIKDDDKEIREKLLKAVDDYLYHVELISLSRCEVYKEYKEHGFTNLYDKYIYTFKKDDVKMMDTSGIRPLEDIEAMLDVYAKMMRYFDGYHLRDEKYYQRRLAHGKAKDTNYFGIYRGDVLIAYFSLAIRSEVALIDECIYTDLNALNKIVSYALKYVKTVLVKTSSYEELDLYFKAVQKRRISDIAVRLEDTELLTKLYGYSINDPKAFFTASDKPLWLSL